MGAEGIYPENWKEMIRGKKVILYNTGVSGLLHGQEKQIERCGGCFRFSGNILRLCSGGDRIRCH